MILVLASPERVLQITQSMCMTETEFNCLSPVSFQLNDVSELFDQNQPDIVIVDLSAEPLNVIGYEVIKRLRASSTELIIVGLTPQCENEAERICLLSQGVDEVLSTNFNSAELRLRVTNRVNKVDMSKLNIIHDPTTGLTLYPNDFRVKFTDDGAEVIIELPKREFNVLSIMVKHPRRIWTRPKILENCWDEYFERDTRLVDGIVYKLRKKVPPCRDRLRTIINTGYQYVPA